MNFTNLKNFIDTLPEYGIPSSDIIVYRDHKELWRHTVGEPLRGDELYYMYSCTKVVTCIAALQLFEQGKFLMKDPIIPLFMPHSPLHLLQQEWLLIM